MGLIWKCALALIGASYVVAHSEPDDDDWAAGDVISRDVCVIGGGSSGTYAAIRLRDMNQSVVVVEHKSRLGGHTETYTDPATETKVDIGVLFFHNTDIVKNYFARFNIPLVKAVFPTLVSKFVDFRSGALVTSYSPSDPSAALAKYAGELAKYPYLLTGFDLPDPVPADLLLPFADFITKHGIQAAAKLLNDFGEGIGDMLHVPTLYVMKLVGLSILDGIQNGFLTTERGDNSELYEKAQAVLSAANALLLDSHVVAINREAKDGHVRIVVKTPKGLKLIKAKKVLLAIPPTPQNLAHFGLDKDEQSLFGQFQGTGYYTGLLHNTGIPDNTSMVNIGTNTLYNIPPVPGAYSINPTRVPGLHSVQYGSSSPISAEKVKEDIINSIRRFKTADTLATTTPEFAIFSDHSPFVFWVPSDAIAAGFYRKLGALQGHRNTFYTGATFHARDSSLLWEFDEALLPRIVA
ncbi:MAG: hypothetical protein M1839_003560 [Geoglossum umbratile]|nr:MAG: hypothetical protein M1839_003560 [Geoglossum umbratile]